MLRETDDVLERQQDQHKHKDTGDRHDQNGDKKTDVKRAVRKNRASLRCDFDHLESPLFQGNTADHTPIIRIGNDQRSASLVCRENTLFVLCQVGGIGGGGVVFV